MPIMKSVASVVALRHKNLISRLKNSKTVKEMEK
jgi:hypothetical protein